MITEALAGTGGYVRPFTCLTSVPIIHYAHLTDVATEARESCDLTNGAPGW